MRNVLNFRSDQIRPGLDAILSAQEIPPGTKLQERLDRAIISALETFEQEAVPAGIIAEIDRDKFGKVFAGEGKNESDNPLALIWPRAQNLALFAVTLGEKISLSIERFFQTGEYNAGYLLDAVASVAADNLAALIEAWYCMNLQERKLFSPGFKALRYSPGYCGWHISGQKKLFEFLNPSEIGISLNQSFLMQPLKSVSGVIVSGDRGIHEFENAYAFCETCRTRSCRERIMMVS
ncbi:MAG: vitamin B12 dependent-methionine synthase activation domain-containing protein [Candidatus Wallbacteria bacterium]|nr:vitamin B12 dependent-methionine synthase activation domain-containing protein [Candidatus Wallbacteria bacterium]